MSGMHDMKTRVRKRNDKWNWKVYGTAKLEGEASHFQFANDFLAVIKIKQCFL